MRKVPGLGVPGYGVLQLALGQSSRGDESVSPSRVNLPGPYCLVGNLIDDVS